jgi:hypothetical protein
VSTTLICLLVLNVAQGPAPRTAVAQTKGDSVRRDPALQPAPTIVVEASSQWPVIVIGVATLGLLYLQFKLMARQTVIFDRQTALGVQQAEWRHDEAIGTFYRLAHDLVAEFKKATVLPGVLIPANFGTHPRQMLREASRLFAPLGNDFIFAANEIALRLDQYFVAVEAYNADRRGREGAERLISVQEFRKQVGLNLDRASSLIVEALRWKYADGKDYDFGVLCSMPPGFLEATAIEASTPTGEARADDS